MLALKRTVIYITKMRLTSYTLFTICCLIFFSCKEEIGDMEVIVISDQTPNINSVIVKEDGELLIDGFIGSDRYFAVVDSNFNLFHRNITNFQSDDKVYSPYPALEVVMKTGDYGSIKGTYLSYDKSISFEESYTFEPGRGDWWLGYIPINENLYLLHAASNWEDSKIVFIENNKRVSNFQKVLKGFNIINGFFDNNTLHVIANEVSNSHPSTSRDVYYFQSIDTGRTWTGNHHFGSLGAYRNSFRKIDHNSIFLYNQHLQLNFISNDNGISWQNIELSVELSDITYLNKSDGLGIFEDKFYVTNDGGISWQVKTTLSHKADHLFFVTPLIGVIYSSSLIGYTSNGGLNWKYMINR